ncbi:MAG: hypothetical protein GWO41_00855 [candidate division Zixibacteria bacterium]|nr:hypothetical protein [candidate division Zixibacteria bacterium]NIW43265.1 hypothetical protein [Gammaproteobacteria bacterium]NIX54398.1 hypothetical protein [candidate division Zixibacteria bacterium]
MIENIWPWLVLLGLGAYHGINPGMGWLFAVALGMQEKKRRAVLDAIPPIALGHAISIAIVVGILWLLEANVYSTTVKIAAAVILIGFGLYRLIRSQHPKWVGMRVGFRDLTLWSFIMASAHGAGLMLIPVLLGMSHGHGRAGEMEAGAHTAHMSVIPADVFAGAISRFAAVGIHTLGYLVVAGLIALLVYEKFGLTLLRRAWFNLEYLWIGALMISGIVILIS